MDIIETKLENKDKILVWMDPSMPSRAVLRQRKDGSQPLFKIERNIVPNLDTKTDKIIENLTKKLEKLKLKSPSSSQGINTIDGISSEEDIKNLEKVFQVEDSERDVLRIQRPLPRPKTRNYYPRPTHLDLQYEERRDIAQSSYDGNTIYEWNIDGILEHQILNILQEMAMAASAYKSKKVDDITIVRYLIIGFISQLKN